MSALGAAWAAFVVVGLVAMASPPVPRQLVRAEAPSPAAGRIAAIVVAVVALVVAGPVAAATLSAIATGALWWRGRRMAQRARDDIVEAVPELLELLALALRGGMAPTAVFDGVSPYVSGPLARPLDDVRLALAAGRPFDAAIVPLSSMGGDRLDQLRRILLSGWRNGVAVADDLLDLARRARDDHHRLIDQRVRRLPVLLLGPLFACLLPAFVLVVVVPLLAVGIQAAGRW